MARKQWGVCTPDNLLNMLLVQKPLTESSTTWPFNMSYHDVQGTDVQLRVLGKNQKATWSRLWKDYSSKCDQEKVPNMSYNSYREIGQMRFPGIQLYKNSVAGKAPKQMQPAKRISNYEV